MMRQTIFEKRKRQTPKMTFVFVLNHLSYFLLMIFTLISMNINMVNYKSEFQLKEIDEISKSYSKLNLSRSSHVMILNPNESNQCRFYFDSSSITTLNNTGVARIKITPATKTMITRNRSLFLRIETTSNLLFSSYMIPLIYFLYSYDTIYLIEFYLLLTFFTKRRKSCAMISGKYIKTYVSQKD